MTKDRKRFVPFFVMIFALCLLPVNVFSQDYASVYIHDEVYHILQNAESRGLCSTLPSFFPYTESQIKKAIEEILDSEDNLLSDTEISILKAERERLLGHSDGLNLERGEYGIGVDSEEDINMNVGFKHDMRASGGLYSKAGNAFGFDFTPYAYARGNIGKHFSYDITLLGTITKCPLNLLGTYCIRSIDGSAEDSSNWGTAAYWGTSETEWESASPSTINTYDNIAFLPFSYTKVWDGSVYSLAAIFNSEGGLDGWPTAVAYGFGMYSEISSSFLDDRVFLRMGRIFRELGGMDNGASLVLNKSARPFLGMDGIVSLFPWLRFSFLTGFMEMPNHEHITNESQYTSATRYQNMYSNDMVEVSFKYFDANFGTSCIWPKRFELGYAYPLFNKVFFQNNVGDFDNLNMFFSMRGKLPGVGSLWFSFFLDEVYGFNRKNGLLSGSGMFTYDRAMFALQGGAKVNIPWLPFTTLSLRYTYVKPYCYTHQQLNKTAWYMGTYVSENYTNNGYALGYYLPPNSDELRLDFTSQLTPELRTSFTYQFARHGADYGSRAVDGSSLWSELNPDFYTRDDMRSFFLHDGAYRWYHIVSTTDSWRLSQFGIPLTLYTTVGFVYTWFTDTDGNQGEYADYHNIDTDEYPTDYGVILSAGIKLYF